MASASSGFWLPVLLAAALFLDPTKVACRSTLYNTSSARIDGKLNVHIISHTHNDPGWLSSYTQYHRPHVQDGHGIGEQADGTYLDQQAFVVGGSGECGWLPRAGLATVRSHVKPFSCLTTGC
jgi:hypothetical protein